MSWRDKIQDIRGRIFGDRDSTAAISGLSARSAGMQDAPIDSVDAGPAARTPVAINLGIDFGTSFTKVCYRDVGTEESGVVAVGEGLENPLLPSVVLVSQGGDLSLSEIGKSQPTCVSVNYLKMRLAGTPIESELAGVAGIDLYEISSVKALAAWFLASVIMRSQEWIGLNEADRLKNRIPVWSANLGVPVEHCDSDALVTFREVLGVAWLWVKDQQIPGTIMLALERYQAAVGRLESDVTDFHAIPEIAAAVQSFVMSREATPGMYVYFDIGGGTVDGVAFNYLNYDGERRINFYSGKVEPLGISAIGFALNGDSRSELDANMLEALLEKCAKELRDEYAIRVRRLVGWVVMTAKRKDGRDWQVDAIQNSDYQRKFIGRLTPDKMKPLVVFLGGGGCKSNWYGSTISSTYKEFNQDQAGIPPYRILSVPSPKDFRFNKSGGVDFTRFAISYGLSIPFGEGPEIALPSQFAEAEGPQQRTLLGVVNYLDSKDVYD